MFTRASGVLRWRKCLDLKGREVDLDTEVDARLGDRHSHAFKRGVLVLLSIANDNQAAPSPHEFLEARIVEAPSITERDVVVSIVRATEEFGK